jgi:hypothetical protein
MANYCRAVTKSPRGTHGFNPKLSHVLLGTDTVFLNIGSYSKYTYSTIDIGPGTYFITAKLSQIYILCETGRINPHR